MCFSSFLNRSQRSRQTVPDSWAGDCEQSLSSSSTTSSSSGVVVVTAVCATQRCEHVGNDCWVPGLCNVRRGGHLLLLFPSSPVNISAVLPVTNHVAASQPTL